MLRPHLLTFACLTLPALVFARPDSTEFVERERDFAENLIDPETFLETLDRLRLQSTVREDLAWSAYRLSRMETRRLFGYAFPPVADVPAGPLATRFRDQVRFRSRLQLDPAYDRISGFHDSSYAGSPVKIYNRLTATSGKIEAGLIQIKDAGEVRVFDHFGGYFGVKNFSIFDNFILRQATLGDYTLSYGSGLIFGGSFASAKSVEAAHAVEFKQGGIRPTISSYNLHTLRGAAVGLNASRLALDLFASRRYLDGRSDSVTHSLASDGYHRTDLEISKRGAVGQTVLGGHFGALPVSTLQLGISGYAMSYDQPLALESPFALKGDALSMLGIDASFVSDDVSISAEAGRSMSDVSSVNAFVVSAITHVANSVTLAAQGRSLPEHFISHLGSVFGESSEDAQNERGGYFGVEWRPVARFTLSSYYDRSSSHSSIYPEAGATMRSDFRSKLAYALNEATFSLQLRFKSAEVVKNFGSSANRELEVGSGMRRNIRGEVRYQLLDKLSASTRYEYTDYLEHFTRLGDDVQRGHLFFQTLRYAPENFQAEARIIRFQTDSYDSRVYEYEGDLPGSSSIAPLYGVGTRYYVLLGVNPVEQLTISFKASQTFFDETRTIGSGDTERTAAQETRLGLQADLRFD